LITVAVDGLKEHLAELTERGIPTHIDSVSGGARKVVVRDPDGNTISFFEDPGSENWPAPAAAPQEFLPPAESSSAQLHALGRIATIPQRSRRISELPSTRAPLPPNRIGYVVRRDGVTFVERSPTGRRFIVVVKHGRIIRENVKRSPFDF
jgi:hypothetical protein